MATPVHDHALRYLNMLAERIESTQYPSKDLMDRLERTLILFWDEERIDEDRSISRQS